MSAATKLGLRALATALVLGVLADMLLRSPQLGLNVFLWLLCLTGGLCYLISREAVPFSIEGRRLILPVFLAAVGLLWRASPALQFLDLAFLAVTFALMVGYGRFGGLSEGSTAEYIARGVGGVFQTLFGPFLLLLRDMKWAEVPHSKQSSQWAAAARGLLIALPLLLIFGALFAAADAVFAHMVTGAFGLNIDQALSHIIFAGFWAWLAAGFFWATLMQPVQTARLQRPAALALGQTEMVIVLGLLNGLFLTFVLIQFRYFFGGAALVEATTQMTYAEYARRGFFELVTVSALVLPVLLAGHWLLPDDRPAARRLYRWLAGALVIQLFIVMASAMKRMMLYQRAFGLTELRFYTTALMIWLALVFVWFALTILRDRWQRFAVGLFVSASLTLFLLNVMNPDAFIAGQNVARLEIGRQFDSQYLTTLSPDAAPVLLAALPKLPESDRQLVAEHLRRLASQETPGGWRTWNFGRAQAQSAIVKQLGKL